MIEGLIVTVGTEELAELCRKRAEYHTERAKLYREQAEKLAGSGLIEPSKFSSSRNPQEEMKEKYEKHAALAGEMAFIAAHLEPCETYRLGASDLAKLGIVASGYW